MPRLLVLLLLASASSAAGADRATASPRFCRTGSWGTAVELAPRSGDGEAPLRRFCQPGQVIALPDDATLLVETVCDFEKSMFHQEAERRLVCVLAPPDPSPR